MGKIKLNLTSGAVVEKPLVNAFKANNINYVVLDNEMNGSMGLPIILVCKMDSNKLVKITDQNEWQIVKEYLKNIIAGNKIEFISVPSELAADDIYYTQLTLPIPSFDSLKNSYVAPSPAVSNPAESTLESSEGSILDINNSPVNMGIEENTNINAPINNIVDNQASENVTPTVNQPVSEVTPSVQAVEAVEPPIDSNVQNPVAEPQPSVVEPQANVNNINNINNIDPNSPVVDIGAPSNPINNDVQVNPEPVMTSTPFSAVGPMPTNNSTNVEPVTPTVEEPVINTEPEESLFKEQKEAFMQACENMFDALVQKFEKELENKNH